MSETLYTAEDVRAILKKIRDAKLKAPKELLGADVGLLQKIFNGIGSASMPPALRKVLTKAYNCAEATAAIHDWRYENSNGTPEAQFIADLEFLANGLAEVRFSYPKWWDWRRWWGERKILIAYNALLEAGESAWCVAYRNNVLQINQE